MKLYSYLIILCVLFSGVCCKINTRKKLQYQNSIISFPYDIVQQREWEKRKQKFLENYEFLPNDSVLYEDFDLGVNPLLYVVKGEEDIGQIYNGRFLAGWRIKFNNIIFTFIINPNKDEIWYISTFDENFICNGYKIGDFIDIERENILVEQFLGVYYGMPFYPLENNWKARIHVSGTKSFQIKYFFKDDQSAVPLSEYEEKISKWKKVETDDE